MEVIMKRVGTLKGQPYNPPGRTESAALAELVASIKEDEIQQPLLITESNEIIDGHRRYAAAKVLRLNEVPCIVIQGKNKEVTARKFERLNTTQKKIGPKDMIFVYANGGNVPPRVAAAIVRLETLLGADQLDRVATMFVTYRIIDHIESVARYCHKDRDDDFKRKVFSWLTETISVFRAEQAMEFGVPPAKMAMAVTENQPLQLSWLTPIPKKGKKK